VLTQLAWTDNGVQHVRTDIDNIYLSEDSGPTADYRTEGTNQQLVIDIYKSIIDLQLITEKRILKDTVQQKLTGLLSYIN
jgi:hypothetical protein